jgi:hypothetical protein
MVLRLHSGGHQSLKLCRIHSVADPAAHFVHHLLLNPARVMSANRFDFELAYAFSETSTRGLISLAVSWPDTLLHLQHPFS